MQAQNKPFTIGALTLCTIIIVLLNVQHLRNTETIQPIITLPSEKAELSNNLNLNLNSNSKPIYVKNLPRTVNPAIFAEAERRLMNCTHLYNKTAGPLWLTPERGEWKYPDQMEWYMIIELIRCEVPFTYTRQSDGEYLVMGGFTIGNDTQARKLDKWAYSGGIGKLSLALRGSLSDLPLDNGIIIQGFVCPKLALDTHKHQVNASKQTTRFITNTYVFAGCNFHLTSIFMNEVVVAKKLNQPVILIVNKDCKHREHLLLQWALDVYYLPDEFPLYWEEHGETMLSTFASIARAYTGVLFLMSGGPGMPPIQIAMSQANPYNQYVSMGSALELWSKGYHSRGFDPWDANCHLKNDAQCLFRKNPITGLSQTHEEYLEDVKKYHINQTNIEI